MTVSPRRWWLIPFALIALASVVVRIWGCFTPLWFDEVFGLVHAEQMRRFTDVFFTQHDDNKHHLTALWLWWLGADAPFFLYRIPSLIAGLALPPLVYFAAKPRHGALVAGLAAFFTLTSYQVLELSCEARGYELAMAFAAGAWLACGKYLQRPNAWLAAAFTACCLFGFLAHLTFLYAYVGLVLWSAWELPRPTWSAWRYRFLILHGPTVIGALWLYYADLQYLYFIGGPSLTLYELFAGTVRDSFNVPRGWEDSLGIVVLALIAVGLISIIRGRDRDWPLFVGVVLCVAWGINHRIRENFALRYIVLSTPFLMVPLARNFEIAARLGPLRWAAMLAAMGFGIEGVWVGATVFCRESPGYPEAIRFMADHSAIAPGVVDCGWDNYVNQLLVDYYCRRAGDRPAWPARPPAQWWVIQPLPDAPQIRRAPQTYRWVATYPNRGFGEGWSLYELEPR
jgi:hypothetical protein